MVRRAVARDLSYLVILAAVTYSILVRIAAFSSSELDPKLGAFALNALPGKLASVAALVFWAGIVLLGPQRNRILQQLRGLLRVPVSGSAFQYFASMLALSFVAIFIQIPVIRTARIRVRACKYAVTICKSATAPCDDELARLTPGQEAYLRVRSETQLDALLSDGTVIWSEKVKGPAYSNPRHTQQLCPHTKFEIACNADTIQVFARNEADRTMSIFGFSLVPVYDAVYPKTAARAESVPTYKPLAIALGSMRTQMTTGPDLVEIPAHDSGLIEIPLELQPPDPETIYTHVTRVCPKLSLIGKPMCLSDWLVRISISPQARRCEAETDESLWDDVSGDLQQLKPLGDADSLKLLAVLRPQATADLVVSTFDRATEVGLKLDMLDAMAGLRDSASLVRLRSNEADQSAFPSVRLRSLFSLAKRDATVHQETVLTDWARGGDVELASRAIEVLPVAQRRSVCRDVLDRLQCSDGSVFVSCNCMSDSPFPSCDQWSRSCLKQNQAAGTARKPAPRSAPRPATSRQTGAPSGHGV